MYKTDRDNYLSVIRIMATLIVILVAMVTYQMFMNKNSNKLEFIDIPAYGVGQSTTRVRTNEFSKTSVHDFANRVFQSLQRWKYNGEVEYEKNIRDHEDVLTPAYMAFLRRDLKRRKGNDRQSELRGRTRMVIPLISGWDDDRVKVVATKNGRPSAWVVLLDMELVEKYKGQDFKRKYLRYPIRVVLFDTDRNDNPWMLAMDGYEDEPKELTIEGELKP
jgi:integrating conjugative element protein (TIGR03746 family)